MKLSINHILDFDLGLMSSDLTNSDVPSEGGIVFKDIPTEGTNWDRSSYHPSFIKY